MRESKGKGKSKEGDHLVGSERVGLKKKTEMVEEERERGGGEEKSE